MTVLKVKNNECQIVECEDSTVLRTIDAELCFKIPGAEFMKYKNWDGKVRLLSKDYKFSYGLLDRVRNILSRLDHEYVLVDARLEKTKDLFQTNVLENLKKLGKEPYHYQIESAAKVLEKDVGIFRMPTGSGKTLTMSLMVGNLNTTSNIYVIGNDLLHQTHKFFKKIFEGIDVGIIGDGICEIGQINVVSVWTAGCALGMDKNKILLSDEGDEVLDESKYSKIVEALKLAKLHIFDECHAVACDTIQAIYKTIKPDYIYGMSASPIRDDNQDLKIEAMIGSKIVDVSASYLIKNGYLVQPIINFIKVPKYPEKLPKSYPAVYAKYIIENQVRNDLVLKGTQALVSKGYKTLVLYNNIKHGKILYELISQKMPCILLSGKDSQKIRDDAKEKIESGEIKVILASKIFDIGVDIPCLSGLVVAASGKSSVRALQRIGRVIRRYTGKKFAGVIDFLDDAHYVKDHSRARRDIYAMEEEFKVICPKN